MQTLVHPLERTCAKKNFSKANISPPLQTLQKVSVIQLANTFSNVMVETIIFHQIENLTKKMKIL